VSPFVVDTFNAISCTRLRVISSLLSLSCAFYIHRSASFTIFGGTGSDITAGRA